MRTRMSRGRGRVKDEDESRTSQGRGKDEDEARMRRGQDKDDKVTDDKITKVAWLRCGRVIEWQRWQVYEVMR